MNALTTLKLTSASSSASRISRSAASTCSGVSRTSPRSDLKTSWMRVLSESNMEDGTPAALNPINANPYLRRARGLGQVWRVRFAEPALHEERSASRYVGRVPRSGPGYTDDSRWPSLSFLVLRYLRVESEAGISSGTASEMARP